MGALSASIVGVSAEKLAFVDLIEREFVAAGYSLPVAAPPWSTPTRRVD